MDISSYVTVLPIVIICYLVGIGCKASNICSYLYDELFSISFCNRVF